MDNLQGFRDLVTRLMGADNAVRRDAECFYDEMKNNRPEQLMLSLLELAVTPQESPEVRVFCSVMLRQVVVAKLYEQAQPAVCERLKEVLKSALTQEKIAAIRTRIADVIGVLAAQLVPAGHWPDLLPFLMECSQSGDVGHRVASMQVFGSISNRSPQLLQDNLVEVAGLLDRMLNDCIQVRVAASSTAVHLIADCDPSKKAYLQPLVPLMLNTVGEALNASYEDEARTVMELLVELAETDTAFLRPFVLDIFNAMLVIAKSEQLDEATRHIAIECPITLAEAKPALARKIPDFLQQLLPVLLDWCTHLEENDNWGQGNYDYEDDDVAMAEESLDRLSISLGGETVAPLLFQIIPAYLQHQEWRSRYAGLMAISVSCEGCALYLKQHLSSVLQMVLPFFSDPHPRVRWAACNTIAQMASDFGTDLTTAFLPEIFPRLFNVMSDEPRVQAHASSAVINLSEHCTAELLAPYLQTVLEKLHAQLESQRVAQEQAVTAVAAVADCVGQAFTPFYDYFVPAMKQILQHANGKEFRLLRGKAMECISLVAVAVGKDVFAKDANEVIQMLHHSQNTLQHDDPQLTFVIQAWARLCKCLGKDFVPYLPLVMPKLLASASLDANLKVHDTDEQQEPDEGWEYLPLGDKTIGIKTSTLEEKATACNMLYWFADELKDGFFPYVEDVAKILVPCLTFFYHDGVRNAAASVMPCLLRVTLQYLESQGVDNRAPVLELWHFMFDAFRKGISHEVDVDLQVLMLECLADCIDLAGPDSLSDKQLVQLAKLYNKLFTKFLNRRQARAQQNETEDFDEFEAQRLDELTEKEDDVIAQIADCTGKLFKHFKLRFLQPFTLYGAHWRAFAEPQSRAHDRQMALCVFDDMTEALQQESIQYVRELYPLYLRYAGDESPDVRQAAVFGLGVLAEHGYDAFGAIAQQAAQALCQAITAPGAREGESAIATDNAICSMAKLCLYQGHNLGNLAEMVMAFFSFLPVVDDKEESANTYGYMCDLIERHGDGILGSNPASLAHILTVVGRALNTDLVDEVASARMVHVVKLIAAQQPEQFAQALSSLPQSHNIADNVKAAASS